MTEVDQIGLNYALYEDGQIQTVDMFNASYGGGPQDEIIARADMFGQGTYAVKTSTFGLSVSLVEKPDEVMDDAAAETPAEVEAEAKPAEAPETRNDSDSDSDSDNSIRSNYGIPRCTLVLSPAPEKNNAKE